MATVNDKMTQLANAIRTKSGATGKLSLDGMISAVNGISTGGGGTTTYQLWGDHSFMPEDFEVGRFAGTYTIPSYSVNSWFYDGINWVFSPVSSIVVYSSGSVNVISENANTSKWYYSGRQQWVDENENFWGDPRLRYYSIPNPITVNKNLYDLFYALYDNGEYAESAFDISYDLGYQDGAENSLPALGVLCDWNVVVDSGSQPIVTIINYHPFYYLVCDVYYGDLSQTDWCIYPDDSDSIHWGDYEPGFGMQGGEGVFIENVRWLPNEI